MPNGHPVPGVLDRMLELGQKAGKYGILGLTLMMGSEIVGVVREPNWQQFQSALYSLGIELTLIGVLANTKRLKDMTATVAAEAKIDRHLISSSLPGRNVSPTSEDPAVQRELSKRGFSDNGVTASA